MSQQIVLEAQQWLNSTYGDNSGYCKVKETGNTGSATSAALVSAMQIELGLSNVTGYFGSMTSTACDENPLDTGSTGNRVKILQYGFYCKGYDAKATDGIFSEDTKNALIWIQQDAGLSDSQISSVAKGLQMQAVLGVDEYKQVSRGDSRIRSMQQEINRNYLAYTGLCPCDGIYSRGTDSAIIFAFQAIEGLPKPGTGTDYDANGYFGNTTKRCCPEIPYANAQQSFSGRTYNDYEIKDFIKLAQFSIYCIGHYPYTSLPSGNRSKYDPGDFNGELDDETKTALHSFQSFVALPERDIIGKNEWMALFVSTGNPDRDGAACDCATKIDTSERAQALKNDEYSIVGRYLTGRIYDDNNVPVSKHLDKAEMQTIIDAGLKLFVIYQDAKEWYEANPKEENLYNYFSYGQGKIDAQKATSAAWGLGVPAGGYIYFTVDYDFMEDEVIDKVIPYFRGINDYANSHTMPFKVGIYGSRNTCTLVANEGLSTSSFVSDLSTGYSGNMGFSLPDDWAFDQVKSYSLYCTTGSFDVDKDVTSGRYTGFNTIARQEYIAPAIPEIPSNTVKIQTLIAEVAQLETLYCESRSDVPDAKPAGIKLAIGVTNYLRAPKYHDTEWTLALGKIDSSFVDYVNKHNHTLYEELDNFISNDTTSLTDGYGGLIDFGHLAATTEGYCSANAPDFWTGWGGDLATGMADTATAFNKRGSDANYNMYLGKTIQEIADMIIGNENSSCKYSDLCTDIDGYKIAKYIRENEQSSSHSLSEAMTWYYSNYANIRFNFYPDDIGCEKTLGDLEAKIYDRMHGLFEKYVLLAKKAGDSTDEMQHACCKALANFIFKELVI